MNKKLSILFGCLIIGCTNTPATTSLSINPGTSASPTTISPSASPVITASPSALPTPLPSPVLKSITDDFVVANATTDYQGETSIANDSQGNSVVTWIWLQSPNVLNVYARRFDNMQRPIGNEFKVNNSTIFIPQYSTANGQKLNEINNRPNVVMDRAGNFIIAWQLDNKLYLRRYNSSGTAQGNEFIPTTDLGDNDDQIEFRKDSYSIKMAGNGNFLVIWALGSIQAKAQLYDKDAKPIGAGILLKPETNQALSAIDSQGNFLIATSKNVSNINLDYFEAQRYDKSGNPQGDSFKVKKYGIPEAGKYSALAMDDNGNFIVSGEKFEGTNLKTKTDIYAQRYNSLNQPAGEEFKININNTKFSFNAITDIAMNNKGDFVITWGQQFSEHPTVDIFARRFNNNGQAREPEFKVNNTVLGIQAKPAIAMNEQGEFNIAWQNFNDNSNKYLIVSRKYNFYQPLPLNSSVTYVESPCLPSQNVIESIKNEPSYNGPLSIKVIVNGKTVEINSQEAIRSLPAPDVKEFSTSQIFINGQPAGNFGTDQLLIQLNKTSCIDTLFSLYNAKGTDGNSLGGVIVMIPDLNKSPVDKIEELVRKFSKSKKNFNNTDISEIQFSSPDSLRTYAIYLDLIINYPYLHNLIDLNGIGGTS